MQLRITMLLLAQAEGVPVYTARAVSDPLHFLAGFYERIDDLSGLDWCVQVKESVHKEVPWLRWEGLLPWSFLTIDEIPSYQK
jgi:hypothetical protein